MNKASVNVSLPETAKVSYKVKAPSTFPPERNENSGFSAFLRPGAGIVSVLLGIFLEGQETQRPPPPKVITLGIYFQQMNFVGTQIFSL